MKILFAVKNTTLYDEISQYYFSFSMSVTCCLKEATSIIQEMHPQVVFIENAMHPGGALQEYQALISKLAQTSDIRVILIVEKPSFQLITQALGSGVSGLVMASDGINEVSQCLISLGFNKSFISDTLKSNVVDINHKVLSPTERVIAKLLVEGYSTSQISNQLFRSAETIKNHRKNIKLKLGVSGGKNALLDYLRYYHLCNSKTFTSSLR